MISVVMIHDLNGLETWTGPVSLLHLFSRNVQADKDSVLLTVSTFMVGHAYGVMEVSEETYRQLQTLMLQHGVKVIHG